MKVRRVAVSVALLSGIGIGLAGAAIIDIGSAEAAGGKKTIRCVGDTHSGVGFRIAFVHNPGTKPAAVTETDLSPGGTPVGTASDFTVVPGGTAFRVAPDNTAVQQFTSKAKLIIDGSMGTEHVDDSENTYRSVTCA